MKKDKILLVMCGIAWIAILWGIFSIIFLSVEATTSGVRVESKAGTITEMTIGTIELVISEYDACKDFKDLNFDMGGLTIKSDNENYYCYGELK